MTGLRLTTSSRLHFGLLSRGPEAPRQFGGVGLMIDRPGLEFLARPAPRFSAVGPLAGRILEVADRVAARLMAEGRTAPCAGFEVLQAPPEHAGLGTGTQLGLAVARALLALAGETDVTIPRLAALTGRGLRSGIGLHGASLGGLIVDGGRRDASGIPPLLSRLPFPAAWQVLVAIPRVDPGLHGSEERRAFATLPPMPAALTDRLCRLVLLGLLPAVVEGDLETFGRSLEEIQHHVGGVFAPAQGGTPFRPELAPLADALRGSGLVGVGQSSWGPALYGFSRAPEADRMALLHDLRDRFDLDADRVFWAVASPGGLRCEPFADPDPPGALRLWVSG